MYFKRRVIFADHCYTLVFVDGHERIFEVDLHHFLAAPKAFVLEGDSVALAGEVDAPVVVGVALGGPAGAAVDEVVGDGYAVVAAVAGDDVLATDEGSL